ncbi:MAG: FKBP-type peptidyl-prolyl cis-trans isomerase [Deltaproteobacteria bacterium]|nr:FKBP-type peptidyl-prolyl cis-trans isomerase [Deltaproteobacteria bacterium]
MNSPSDYEPYKIQDSGSYVKIRYRVRIVDGPSLKGSPELETMDFVTGYGHVIPGLEKRLVGETNGRKLTFDVPAQEAFGMRDEKMVFLKKIEEFHFPPGVKPFPGMEIPVICNDDEGPGSVTIKDVREDGIVIDFNHALAGFALGYELEIIEARHSRESDVCAEWDKKGDDDFQRSCLPHEIVLGEDS